MACAHKWLMQALVCRRWPMPSACPIASYAKALAGILLLGLLPSAALAADEPPKPAPADRLGIQQVELVHFSHTDYGFTDHPAVCRELQRRYLDVALDAALATRDRPAGERFCWTAETTVAVDDWWRAAPLERREQFLAMVRAGQLEVAALPLNQTPTLNARQ